MPRHGHRRNQPARSREYLAFRAGKTSKNGKLFKTSKKIPKRKG